MAFLQPFPGALKEAVCTESTRGDIEARAGSCAKAVGEYRDTSHNHNQNHIEKEAESESESRSKSKLTQSSQIDHRLLLVALPVQLRCRVPVAYDAESLSFKIRRSSFDEDALFTELDELRLKFDYNTHTELLTIMVEGGPHARASHLLYLWIQDALNVACTATHTAATTIASQQATEAGELDAFLAALNYMGSRRIKLPDDSVKSPDGSFWPTPAPCPSIIFLVAMSQSWDSVLEEAEIYLTNLYPALVRVVVLKMCHKAPDRVVRGGDVRIAAVECAVAEDDDEGGGPTLRGRVVLDKFIQKDGQMCHNTSTEDLDLIFALADFAHRNDRSRVARLGKVVRLPFVKLQALVREIEHIFADDSPIDTNLGPEKYPGLRIKPNLQRPAS